MINRLNNCNFKHFEQKKKIFIDGAREQIVFLVDTLEEVSP